MKLMTQEQMEAALARAPIRRRCGRVTAADGAALTVAGLSGEARIGDRVNCAATADGDGVAGEVVALSSGEARVMTFDAAEGVALDAPVWLLPDQPIAPCDGWLGRIIDAFGAPLDSRPLPQGDGAAVLRRRPPRAANRAGLGPRLRTGLAVTDTILPLARGQRIGLFAGSGVGKSRLLADLARELEADCVVFALIGERGRELNEFVREGLGEHGRSRALIVASTSDESPLNRRRAAWTAMAAAEHFRDQGRHVLLIVDSLTRFAEAHREIALTAGETPSLRAYPPSTTSMIAALAERAGPDEIGRRGAITAVFSVLVAGSDMDEPVADITRGVLDGHVVLTREIAERGRFPAIDVARSVSRALPAAATEAEAALIAEARRTLGLYERAEPMIRAGLHQPGADPDTDRAVARWRDLDAFFAASSASNAEAFAALSRALGRDAAPAR